MTVAQVYKESKAKNEENNPYVYFIREGRAVKVKNSDGLFLDRVRVKNNSIFIDPESPLAKPDAQQHYTKMA